MLDTGYIYDYMIIQKENNIIITVTVKTNQSKQNIQFNKNKIYVYLKSTPQKNNANIELVKIFTKVLKRPVILISGRKSKIKKLVADNITTKKALETLKEISIK
ncbi:hypothetical protein GQ473_00675 [archaeon]|nr:hypothetical protein [archaeon]